METGRPADVLPDREAATVQAWLEEHPGTEVICRDRAGAYAQAARDGAPGAVQVADRWHLWHNLCEHAGKAVARHKDCLAADRCQHEEGQQHEQDQQHEQEQEAAAGLEAVIGERHQQVQQLRAGGKTPAQAAAALGLSVQVTGRYWRAARPAALLPARATSALDRWKPYLHRRRPDQRQGPARGDHRARLRRQLHHHL
jgi:hypothetical protein